MKKRKITMRKQKSSPKYLIFGFVLGLIIAFLMMMMNGA